MLDSIYHMTKKLFWNHIFGLKMLGLCQICDVKSHFMRFPENLKTTRGLSILMHGVNSLPEATSYDKFVLFHSIEFWKCYPHQEGIICLFVWADHSMSNPTLFCTQLAGLLQWNEISKSTMCSWRETLYLGAKWIFPPSLLSVPNQHKLKIDSTKNSLSEDFR